MKFQYQLTTSRSYLHIINFILSRKLDFFVVQILLDRLSGSRIIMKIFLSNVLC